MKKFRFGDLLDLYMKDHMADPEVDAEMLKPIKDWTVHFTKGKDPDDPNRDAYYIFFEEPEKE